MRIYNYIFFKIYQILTLFDESPTFATIMVMCWLFLFNSFTLIDFLIRSNDVSVFSDKYVSISFSILILAIHSLYFYHKDKYVYIIEKYEKESKKLSIYGTLSVILYIFLSIWVFYKFTIPFIGGK